MYRLLATLLIVSCLGALVTQAQTTRGRHETHAAITPAGASDWVRTVDGWQRRHEVLAPTPRAELPRLHPAVVAGFLAAASTLVLVAFPGPQRD